MMREGHPLFGGCEDSARPKQGGWAAGALCWGGGWAVGDAQYGWVGPETGFSKSWRFADSPVSLRAPVLSSAEGDRSALKLWKGREQLLELQAVLVVLCGPVGVHWQHCQVVQMASKQCPVSPGGTTGVGSSASSGLEQEELGKLCGGLYYYLGGRRAGLDV